MIGGIRVKIAPKTIPVVVRRVDAYGGKTGYTLYGTKCVNLLERFERNGINEMADREYIERVSLIKFVKQNTPNIHGDTTMRSVERTLKAVPPAADVVEVRHSQWDEDKYPFCNVCPECGLIIDRTCIKRNSGKFNLCPNCGAKMGGERKEQT